MISELRCGALGLGAGNEEKKETLTASTPAASSSFPLQPPLRSGLLPKAGIYVGIGMDVRLPMPSWYSTKK